MNTSIITLTIRLVVIILVFRTSLVQSGSKVVEFGSKLPEFVEQYPNRNWLIKFYAPWCHYCQQLEITYNNVAETIYHKHDNLIVGQVDCTKYKDVCSQYDVTAYPAITFITRDNRYAYNGDRSLDSIVNFADRLLGPDVLTIRDCNHLKDVTNDKTVIILSNIKSRQNVLAETFKSLSTAHKTTWWFYYYEGLCENLLPNEGVHIMKRDLYRAISFNYTLRGVDDDHKREEEAKLEKAMLNWLKKESFPVYAPFFHVNSERILRTNKLIVMAILDEYKPAGKFTPLSRDFNTIFHSIAKKVSRSENNLLFAWSSDLDFIQSIAISNLPVPNVMVLRRDLSYQILIEEPFDNQNLTKLPPKLSANSIKKFIEAIKQNKVDFQGGNSYYHRIQRFIFQQYLKARKVFRSDPLLASILIVSPLLILIFVVWNTCCRGPPDEYNAIASSDDEDGDDDDDEDGNYGADEVRERLLRRNNHRKQD